MSATITKQTLVDGSRNLVVKIHIAGDAGGDVTNYVLIDASTYTPAFTNCKLDNLDSKLSGFTANLQWDATSPVPFMNLPDYDVHLSNEMMHEIGGIYNNGGAGRTGDVLMTTTGLGAGDYGTIILHIIKKDA